MTDTRPKAWTYENKLTGRMIIVTGPAVRLIGPNRVAAWAGRLAEFMADVGLKTAYVSRCGSHVEVNLGV